MGVEGPLQYKNFLLEWLIMLGGGGGSYKVFRGGNLFICILYHHNGSKILNWECFSLTKQDWLPCYSLSESYTFSETSIMCGTLDGHLIMQATWK